MANPIITENQNTGSTAWKPNNVAATQIQAYADATSYNPGDTVNFYVSTQVASTTYSVNIYRMGWYGGAGGCLKSTTTGRVGVAQGYSDGNTLTNCPTAIIDATTHNIEAGWTSTDSWAIPANAVTGIYLAQFTDANNWQWYVAFVVRGNSTADYVYVRPFTTDQAYNTWGGYSLYSATKATKVSFNRPCYGYAGTGGVFHYEIPGIRWLESQGYNLSYLSDIDVHATANILNTYKVYLSAGHDEYWTLEMRNAVTAARDAGISLAFLGANACYWQIRLENDNAGHANKTVTCYKVGTPSYSADPFYGVDNTRVTTQWRDPLLNKPENALIGIMYYDNTQGSNAAWVVDPSPDTTYFAGTGLIASTSYGSDLVGNEWDNNLASPSTAPSGLKTIATSQMTTGVNHGTSNSLTTFYRASSGALVFATGSLAWTWALDPFRFQASSVPVIPQMQVLMQNIMGALKGPVFNMVSV